MSETHSVIDIQAITARIDRDLMESRKLREESDKLLSERKKLDAEERKLRRDSTLAPLVITASVIASLLSGVVAAVITKVLG